MPESYNKNEYSQKECQVRMDMSDLQSNHPESDVVPASEQNKLKRALKWVLTGLPLGGVIWASFLPLATWMQQALILVVLLWFYVFFLLDAFYLGG